MLIRKEGLPVPMMLISKIMCLCSGEELATVCLSTSDEACGRIGQLRSTRGPRADMLLDIDNEIRAVRWTSWLLSQVLNAIVSSCYS